MMKKNQSSLGANCDIIKDNIDILLFCEQHYNCVFIPGTNGWYNTNCILPDHDDNNPSFGVNIETNTFHCFGCGSKGSIIDLVIMAEKMDLSQAVNFLLDYLDIQPDISSSTFYKIKKLLKPRTSVINRDALIDAKINVMKKKGAEDSVAYYKRVCKLFGSYGNDNDRTFVKSIYDS